MKPTKTLGLGRELEEGGWKQGHIKKNRDNSINFTKIWIQAATANAPLSAIFSRCFLSSILEILVSQCHS